MSDVLRCDARRNGLLAAAVLVLLACSREAPREVPSSGQGSSLPLIEWKFVPSAQERIAVVEFIRDRAGPTLGIESNAISLIYSVDGQRYVLSTFLKSTSDTDYRSQVIAVLNPAASWVSPAWTIGTDELDGYSSIRTTTALGDDSGVDVRYCGYPPEDAMRRGTRVWRVVRFVDNTWVRLPLDDTSDPRC